MFGSLPVGQMPIGLDIGTDTVNMIQLQKTGTVVSVKACGRWRAPEAGTPDPGQYRKLVVKAVREILRQNDFSGRRVVSALSYNDLCIKNVRVPRTGGDLYAAVYREAQERFNFDMGPDQLKYLVAGEVRSGDDVYDEVVILAADPKTVSDHLRLLSDMGLQAEHIDAEPVAIFRVFESHLRRRVDEEAVNVVVDLGASGTRVVVARGRQIVFIKSIDIGGRRLTESVARHLNVAPSEAAEMRMRSGRELTRESDSDEDAPVVDRDSVNWTLHDAVRGEAEQLAKEISLCLRYCSVTFRGLRPQRIMLTGGEVYDPSVLQVLQENLNVECVAAHPLQGMDVAGVDLGGERRGTLSEWTVAAGLAMRGMKFEEKSQEAGHERHRLSA